MKSIAAILFALAVAPVVAAAEFQNLDFENYSGGQVLPGWQYTYEQGDGTIFYDGVGPILGDYPYLGFTLSLPVMYVNGYGSPPAQANVLQGNHSLTMVGYNEHFGFMSESVALAALDDSLVPGIAQIGDVPTWAKSFWIAFPGAYSSFSDGVLSPIASFSGHPLLMSNATTQQSITMLQNEGLAIPPGLDNPNSAPDFRPPMNFWAGNIETIAGLSRRLKITTGRGGISELGGTGQFEVLAGSINFDILVFSSQPWDGPAVNVPEPATALLLLPTVAVLRRRRHHA
jgi:hypothetical protein